MRKTITLALLLISVSIIVYSFALSSPSPMTKHCIVKLYDGGNVVQTWEAVDFGQVDGQILVFSVGSDPNPRRVRIHGTWSIEEKE
jgi:hypothetical protein